MDTTSGAADPTSEINDTSAKEPPQASAVVEQTADLGTEDVADVPDPDEDDLDDLDDMLQDFSAGKVDGEKSSGPQASNQPSSSGAPGAPDAEKIPGIDSLLSDDEFAKQFQAEMRGYLGLDESGEMTAEFEKMFKGLSTSGGEDAGAAAVPGASNSTSTPGATSVEDSFQDTIRRTMERMQASGDQAQAAAAAGGSDDFMAEMMKYMQDAEGGGLGNDEEMSKMLLGMMEQLTNKEILYDPMKELNDKFPDWMEKNKETVSKDDWARYEEQQRLVKEIVAKFEEPTYADSNAADREFIVDRMTKMQSTGSPPADLVGDMPSAQDAFGMSDDACNPQ